MKKLNVLKYAAAITGIVLLLISCSKEDDTVSENELIVGSWNMTVEQKISGKDGSILKNNEITGCSALEDYIFTREGRLTFTAYRKMANGECERREDLDATGTYVYDAVSSTLTFTVDNITTTFHIPVLTATEMRFRAEISDDNGDGVNDFLLYIFKK